EFVSNRQAAIALGKALFWDMQVGSDGVQACASCHFRAGADPRSKNQVSPGLKRHVPEPDFTFTTPLATRPAQPNSQLEAKDFPLTRLAVPGMRGALDPATDSNDAVSSQGVHHPEGKDPQGFVLNGVNVRRVEPRNTPSVINAVFNHRQFWDGRAENIFNGVNHLGARDTSASVFRADVSSNPLEVQVSLVNSSLASQAVAPIVSDLEMASPGRTALDVGRDLARSSRKIFKDNIQNLRPLAKQQVHPNDSVLGPLSRWPNPGLAVPTYDAMIKAAFHPRWWASSRIIRVNEKGTKSVVKKEDGDSTSEEYTLIQYNFTLFFGLAIQLYESTLVSDDTPWDRFRRDHPLATDPALNPWTNLTPSHISRQALFGAHLFNDRKREPTNIRCSNCHEEAELTDASVSRINNPANGPVRNRDGNVIDRGFNNIGLRPTIDDLGVGATDAFGHLSLTRRLFPDAPPATFGGAEATPPKGKGFGVQGAFKIPSLRNVALTAPYFHNGDMRTLREVMDFYSRGGNVAPIKTLEGFQGATCDPKAEKNPLNPLQCVEIEPLGRPALTEDEINALVAFLKALTDERVLNRRAPFDHPQLFVTNGHPGGTSPVDADGDGLADDIFIEIPAVGAAGGPPLPGFLEGVFGPPPPP
ncbi:MAG TPA: cytochrome c peroxidase, partial [Gemmatimonadales bacterium]|nr:cytochrome c peroxidase [Gemmatimonadales bacterium]